MHAAFSELCRERGAGPLPELEFIHTSPWLNLMLYPDEVDYARAEPLGDGWHNLQSSVRATDEPWEPPAALAAREGPLVYLSLGSLGSADVELMQGLVDILADAPYRVIVSKGPQHELLRLPDTMAGEEFLPQTSILPQVDAVITHGGNNTVTECLHFGKPMVVLPLFWDQYDNAQRMHETGFGVRLDTYGHAPEELLDAVDGLLADTTLGERLAAVSARLQAHRGTEVAAGRIEDVANGGH
jgi:MGT family glycosyltransferase